MGANATTKVPSYVAGQVLTAADLSITNSGIPVFANSTDRTNSFGGTGEKTLAEGQFAYLEDDNKTYYYDGAAWQQVGASGLTFITGATFTTATSFSLPNNTFSSTYRNYRIIITVNTLTSDSDFTMRLRASGTDDSGNNYRNVWIGYNTVSSTDAVVTNPATSFSMREMDSAANVNYSLVLDVIGPQVAFATNIHGQVWYLNKAATAYISSMVNGVYNAATQFDSLSFISSVASSMTGVYRVYGYADS